MPTVRMRGPTSPWTVQSLTWYPQLGVTPSLSARYAVVSRYYNRYYNSEQLGLFAWTTWTGGPAQGLATD
jgi:hypothetical protein